MQYIKIILLLTFFISVLDAGYLRTIRIGTFLTNNDAQEALLRLNDFKQMHPNLLELQKEWNFEFRARKSGKYYITLVEPFTKRAILQEVINTLRIEYKDVYVTRLQEKKIDTQVKEKLLLVKLEETIKPVATPIKKIKPTVKELIPVVETIEIIEHKSIQERLPERQIIIKEIPKPSAGITIWQILFFIAVFILMIVLGFIFKIKRENETYINKDIILSEKFEQLQREMKDKEKFLSHASHELRTPMTSIIGLSHLVLESGLGKVQNDYVRRIKSSSENLLNIVNDILDISKIQAGELKIEKVEFNINDMLDYVLNIISLQAKNNNIDIVMSVDNDVPSHIVGDSLRLGQILINLLGNAVKFTKDGEVILNVRKLSNHGNAISLEFSVSDTGIGMTNAQVSEIFHSYSQANESTSRKFGGTGLGLSITKQLVEMMDGEIKVDSKINVGTTFTCSVKFKLKDSDNKRQYRLPSVEFLNKKVLIVDSSNRNVISLIQTFGYFKYEIQSIPSFEEVVLEEDTFFDIILVNQTKLTSLAIKRLKEIHLKDKSKIVVLSELYSSLHNDLLQDLKIDAYLKTPFTQQSILNIISELYIPVKSSKKSKKKVQKDILKGMSGKKILVAEDNELNHKVIVGLLSKTGIELTFATDGKEALELVEEGINFDMILMDINMPKMNGYEVAQEIRKNAKYNNLPILAFTADVMDEAISEALSSGMQGHISKPIIIDIFYKKIFDALSDTKVEINNIKSNKKISVIKNDTEFEELSTGIGLERCDNDVKFYKSILKDFKIMYLNSAKVIEELCHGGYFKDARHKAMDIKDVSLNIGAYNLCEHAATMEYEFEKGDRSNWNKLIHLYAISLEKLIKDIDKYLDKV